MHFARKQDSKLLKYFPKLQCNLQSKGGSEKRKPLWTLIELLKRKKILRLELFVIVLIIVIIFINYLLLFQVLPTGSKVGVDPWVITHGNFFYSQNLDIILKSSLNSYIFNDKFLNFLSGGWYKMLQVCNYNINFVVMQTLSNCPCCSK